MKSSFFYFFILVSSQTFLNLTNTLKLSDGGKIFANHRRDFCSRQNEESGRNIDEAVCWDLSSLQDEFDKIKRHQVEEQVKFILNYLQGFMVDSRFDFQKFSLEKDALRQFLSHISNVFGVLAEPYLLVTDHIIQDMAQAAHYMELFYLSNDPSHQLVCEVTELLIRAMLLKNYQGSLDFQKDGYVEEIVDIWNGMVYSEAKFRFLNEVMFRVSLIFHNQVFQGKEILQKFSKDLWEHKRIKQ